MIRAQKPTNNRIKIPLLQVLLVSTAKAGETSISSNANVVNNVLKNIDYQVDVALSKYSDLISNNELTVIGAYNDFKNDFERSFKRLRIETIDFYGFHAVNQSPDLEKVMKEPLSFLKEEKEKGRIRYIAITGHNPATLTEAVKTGEFSMAMFPFNVIEQEPLDTLLDTANREGVATSVMKPLGGGMIENKNPGWRVIQS